MRQVPYNFLIKSFLFPAVLPTETSSSEKLPSKNLFLL